MAKRQTFADKVQKVRAGVGAHCPVCDEVYQVVKVRSVNSEDGRMKMTTKSVKVCKCNNSEVFG